MRLLEGETMASDISLAVGDGARRMTYAELAAVRGISLPSARRLVLRRHWPRQVGNDGFVRVTVPLDEARPPTRVTTTTPTTSDPADPTTALGKDAVSAPFADTTTPEPVSHATDPTTVAPDTVTAALTRALDSLREQLAIANSRAARAERRVDELQAMLAEERRRLIMLLTDRRSWWRRWFR
jgi:hypothetical protein